MAPLKIITVIGSAALFCATAGESLAQYALDNSLQTGSTRNADRRAYPPGAYQNALVGGNLSGLHSFRDGSGDIFGNGNGISEAAGSTYSGDVRVSTGNGSHRFNQRGISVGQVRQGVTNLSTQLYAGPGAGVTSGDFGSRSLSAMVSLIRDGTTTYTATRVQGSQLGAVEPPLIGRDRRDILQQLRIRERQSFIQEQPTKPTVAPVQPVAPTPPVVEPVAPVAESSPLGADDTRVETRIDTAVTDLPRNATQAVPAVINLPVADAVVEQPVNTPTPETVSDNLDAAPGKDLVKIPAEAQAVVDSTAEAIDALAAEPGQDLAAIKAELNETAEQAAAAAEQVPLKGAVEAAAAPAARPAAETAAPAATLEQRVAAAADRLAALRKRDTTEGDAASPADEQAFNQLGATPGQKSATVSSGSGSSFDAGLQAAEAQLAEGRYLEAERSFRAAAAMEGATGAAVVGQFHAQLGAGLYRSAAMSLRWLLMRHPRLLGVRFEAPLVPDAERLTRLQDELERRAARGGVHAVDDLLLLAWIDRQQGAGQRLANRLDALNNAGDPLIGRLREAFGTEGN